ncbi:hypothetical protein [Oceanibaculum nanhaiense]|uniref:hypothetical protein n=1 Tax=Oceanibaculum nanhaiense TaxID=1909734 RepID=UPI001121BF8B|nr:hypothetical protein [Oceanibaculum nanhaiense]|tara:strand:+ start:32 stop:541 length:510 start_codon:yes stop_codon:yes gene_type:complete
MGCNIVDVPSHYIGDFKVGDNIAYNSDVLCELVNSNDGGRFNKLIVIQAASILEASLGEIIYRAQKFYIEGLSGIKEKDLEEIRGKKIDKLNNIILIMQKYKILHNLSETIYSEINELRILRNKIHIQDDIGNGFSRDEDAVFTNELRDRCLRLLLLIIEFLRVCPETL